MIVVLDVGKNKETSGDVCERNEWLMTLSLFLEDGCLFFSLKKFTPLPFPLGRLGQFNRMGGMWLWPDVS